MANFYKAVEKTLSLEGGYVCDPDDTGGETNFGITVVVAKANGYTGNMKDMTKNDAKAIYKKRYWDDIYLDEINSQDIAEELFDTGVNMGQNTAIKFLQRCLNGLNRLEKDWDDISVDGKIGPITIYVCNKATRRKDRERNLLKLLNAVQGTRYLELVESREINEKYLNGWISHRVEI